MLFNNLSIKSLLNLFLASPEVLLLKYRGVFVQFNCWPDAFSFTYRIHFKESHSARDDLQKIRLSSLKNK